MAVKKPRSQKSRSVAQGRPPLAKTQPTSLSSKATRTLIRSHHNLHKAYRQAWKDGDDSRARQLEAEIAIQGGLAKYQLASAKGQSAERGGDSSRVLVEWLRPIFDETQSKDQRLRVLEIGALSTKNACSRVACLDVKRIDLKSQEAGIEEVDFMDMTVPKDSERFHIISLSLVLNYVPDSASRGAMLARLPKFLEIPTDGSIIPSLFLVLPLACVANSRYLTDQSLSFIMRGLGFHLSKRKTTSKLYYSLWTFEGVAKNNAPRQFKKEELRSGATRNNFAISLCNGGR